MTIRAFEVGGCVRDGLLGRRSNDIDFAVEARFDQHAAHDVSGVSMSNGERWECDTCKTVIAVFFDGNDHAHPFDDKRYYTYREDAQ